MEGSGGGPTGCCAASNAVDGDPWTYWSSDWSDPQWLQLDLGATYTITRVVLDWEAYATAYQIQTLSSGTDWTTVYSTTTGGDGGMEDLQVTGTGRFVRMYGTQRGTSFGYALSAFDIYGY
jgi:hypothetical protein